MRVKISVIGALVIGLALGLVVPKLANLGTAASAGSTCTNHSSTSQSHNIMIMGGKAEPQAVMAKRCDTLTITNMDSGVREIAFGVHETHIAYDGIAEKSLASNKSFTITLVEAGNFTFHDHLDDSSQGGFTVSK